MDPADDKEFEIGLKEYTVCLIFAWIQKFVAPTRTWLIQIGPNGITIFWKASFPETANDLNEQFGQEACKILERSFPRNILEVNLYRKFSHTEHLLIL